jgi:predicted neutral ceramidase superfamily lipid hydrolase
MRTVLGIIAGVVIAFILIYCVEMINTFYIQPPGEDLTDAQWEDYFENLPASAFIVVLFAHGIGTALGAFIAQSIAKSIPLTPAAIVGFIVLVGAIVNLFAYTHPIWFIIVDLLIILPIALLGGRFAKRMTY